MVPAAVGLERTTLETEALLIGDCCANSPVVKLREAEYGLSGPALTQYFQGTVHERMLAAAEADMLNWGESFDVAAEFDGLMSKLNEGQRRQQFQTLQAKLAQGGLSGLSDSEREQYLQLLQRV